MRSYVRPSFEYVALSVEEKFALGSQKCTVYGSCPTRCDEIVIDLPTGGSISQPVNFYP